MGIIESTFDAWAFCDKRPTCPERQKELSKAQNHGVPKLMLAGVPSSLDSQSSRLPAPPSASSCSNRHSSFSARTRPLSSRQPLRQIRLRKNIARTGRSGVNERACRRHANDRTGATPSQPSRCSSVSSSDITLFDEDEKLAREEELLEEEFQTLREKILTPRVDLSSVGERSTSSSDRLAELSPDNCQLSNRGIPRLADDLGNHHQSSELRTEEDFARALRERDQTIRILTMQNQTLLRLVTTSSSSTSMTPRRLSSTVAAAPENHPTATTT